jgi:hydroxyacylglutathione hydrolase
MGPFMQRVKFGEIEWIQGENQGHFPFCNTLLIQDGIKVVIDPGAGLELMTQVSDHVNVDLVINTHFHFDHIAYNYLFRQSKIYLNEIEGECFQDRRKILKRLGMTDFYGDEWAQGWLDRISRPDSVQSPYSPQNRHEWWLSTERLDGTYGWGDIMDFGATKMEIIGTPGHSAGICCLHFPDEGVLYTGDIDLTSFGPWYFGADGDIELFIHSAETIAQLNAETYITGHEAGIVPRSDFQAGLKRYLEIIDRRDETILNALAEPRPLADICSMGLIYGKKFLIDEWVRAWDAQAIQKHLDHLITRGMIQYSDGIYIRI